MSEAKPIYMYRRKGQQAWATCDAERYEELRGLLIFSTMTAYAASDYDALVTGCARLHGQLLDDQRHITAIITERDAALAELAALKGGQEAVAWAVCREPGKVDALSAAYASESAAKAHVNSYATKGCSGLHVTPLYPAPPAQASAWVPVSERLPAETYAYGCHTDDVLCRTRSGKLIIAMLAQTTTGPVWYDQQSQERDVTHWQPLPAAPTPGASDGKGGDV